MWLFVGGRLRIERLENPAALGDLEMERVLDSLHTRYVIANYGLEVST